MKNMKWLFPSVLLLLLLVSCRQAINLDEPPHIIYGQDVCDRCNMIISEARFAAAYMTIQGEMRHFDDIGDLLAHDQAVNEDVHLYWVHDFHSQEWIKANEAAFVLNPGLITPMGWGLAAFADPAEANAYATQNDGTVTAFADLLQEVAAGSLDPNSLAEHIHEHDVAENMSNESMGHDLDNE